MGGDDALHGEVARALTLGGMSFMTGLTEVMGADRTTRLYHVGFEGPEAGSQYTVYAYISGGLLIAICGVRLTSDDPAGRLRMIEALTAKVPLARLIRDPRGGTPLLAWVEAANVLPPAGVPWASEQSHFLATLPVNAVSTGVRLLLAEFSEQVRSAEGERFPMLDLAVAADPSSRSNIPAAPKAKG